MAQKRSKTVSGEQPLKTKIRYRISKRSIMAGDSRRVDGLRVTHQQTSVLTTEELANEIQVSGSLTRGDVIHVINDLQRVIVRSLQQGRMVALDNIGTFDISIGTKEPKYANQPLYNDEVVVKGVTYRPSATLMAELQNVSFECADDIRTIRSAEEALPLVRQWFETHEVLTISNYATLSHCSESTARRRLRALVAAARLQPYPHTRNCFIPDVNLRSTTR